MRGIHGRHCLAGVPTVDFATHGTRNAQPGQRKKNRPQRQIPSRRRPKFPNHNYEQIFDALALGFTDLAQVGLTWGGFLVSPK